ncbi:hypothetical protein PUN28_002516 [Cardiocondyla obscurior]|uniref:Uncharacterized protein n=1 Tax=Cardiocondyla obscurior TaxID=286306 RepID=A0AAW2GUX5_9HYME
MKRRYRRYKCTARHVALSRSQAVQCSVFANFARTEISMRGSGGGVLRSSPHVSRETLEPARGCLLPCFTGAAKRISTMR